MNPIDWQTRSYNKIENFLQDNLAYLEQNEAANNLIIGYAFAIAKHGNPVVVARLASIMHGGQIELCCLQTPPRQLMLYSQSKSMKQAVQLLINHYFENDWVIPGIVASKDLAYTFAAQWQQITQQKWVVQQSQLVYQLDSLSPISLVGGKLRKAKDTDLALMAAWMEAFLQEAMNESNQKLAATNAADKIKEGSLYVWEDQGLLVSMVAASRPTRHGITINYVYTPSAFRGKGYATSSVWKLSEMMLNQYQFCSLFTDSTNPASNKIYYNIGYRPIKEFSMLSFES